jgi:hypothetical protein
LVGIKRGNAVLVRRRVFLVFDVKPLLLPTLHRGSHGKFKIMSLSAGGNNRPAQFRLPRQSNTRAEAEEKFPENPMGFDPQKRLAKSDKASNV